MIAILTLIIILLLAISNVPLPKEQGSLRWFGAKKREWRKSNRRYWAIAPHPFGLWCFVDSPRKAEILFACVEYFYIFAKNKHLHSMIAVLTIIIILVLTFSKVPAPKNSGGRPWESSDKRTDRDFWLQQWCCQISKMGKISLGSKKIQPWLATKQAHNTISLQ